MNVLLPKSWEQLHAAARRAGVGGAPARYVTHLLSFDPPSHPERVSVVVAVSAGADELRARATLASIRAQTGVDLEIVLSEQGFAEPRHAELAASFGAAHAVETLDPRANGERFNLGRARNVGIGASTGEFVYLTDADVLLPHAGYLAALLPAMREHPRLVLTRPPLSHLAPAGQEDVLRAFAREPAWPPPGVRQPSPMLWTASDEVGEYIEVRNRGKLHIASVADLWAAAGHPPGWEPRLVQACRHDGALLARRAQLDAVAGYGEEFIGWGGEDVDLLWKLAGCFTPASLEHIADAEVVHLDHERGWYDKLLTERNRMLRERRAAAGVLGVILEDLLGNDSPYARALRERTRVHIGAPA